MADRRDPADRETGQFVRLAGAGSPHVRASEDRGQAGQVHPVWPGDQAEHRLGCSVVGAGDEDEGLHDLAELGTDRAGRVRCGMRGLREDRHLELDALAEGGLKDAPNGGVFDRGWHGRESSIRGRPNPASIDLMKAIVFDWDGTLVDTLPAITEANAEVLSSYGIAFDPEAYRAAYTPDWHQMYVRLGIDRERIPEAAARWVTAYRRLIGEVRPLPGAVDALDRLAGAGVSLGLVTAGERTVVEQQLVSTGLGHRLPVRVFGGDLPVMKPHPAPLRRALAELGLEHAPEQTAYLGDAPDDMRMARTVGARGVGVESMLGARADLEAAGAAEVVGSVADWVDRFLAAS
ncbi:MAG: HAD-superfamily hydrolase, subfamily variant 1 [Chloroflexi bacterium]|nr:HAD-superfamily hydrolase, subfamily variant 1 [Chloroflexota bacterium]